ncbi:MAG: putative LPS assembly protein LptD [Bdellovibrionota bacterium]
MLRYGRFLFFLGSFLCVLNAEAATLEFKADYYTRDLGKNITRAKGNAWVKRDSKEIYADELEIDFSRELVTARGHVHIRDANVDIWCDFANYNMRGENAVLENATLTIGQVVMTGDTVNRIDRARYEITEGTYTNCNTEGRRDPDVGGCTYDWKVFGSWLSVTIGEYVHIQDALIYANGFPVMYFPYFIFSIKTERQSGVLMPLLTFKATLGTGINIPFFWAINEWQDLTVEPTVHTARGLHLGLKYRYNHSNGFEGRANVYLLQRRYTQNRDDPAPDDTSRSRAFGLFGEGAVDLRNSVPLGGRAFSRQVIRYVSNPFYMFDYSEDIDNFDGQPSLRSQLFFTWPGDRTLVTAELQHRQSLIIPEDSGVDRGEVSKLPSLGFSLSSTPFLNQYFSYEFDANLTNFYRGGPAFDAVPAALVKGAKVHSDPDPNFGTGDYLRVGRRLKLEPRLVANIPMPDGVQFQPLLRAGTLLYHFDLPASQLIHREYATIELPASLYFSKTYETSIPGAEKINHVVQPRFIYANNFFQGGNVEADHPFFYSDTTAELSNPRFDQVDLMPQFEYMRFELINRFRRKTDSGVYRFFLLQISEQYNVNRSALDPQLASKFGPIEILSELEIWRFRGQMQARYQLQTTQTASGAFIRENEWSASLSYLDPGGDYLTLISRFSFRADSALTQQTGILHWYKTLPIIFDLEGMVEYSFKQGLLVRYAAGLHFGKRKSQCWQLTVHLGQNEFRQPFARLDFKLGINPTMAFTP